MIDLLKRNPGKYNYGSAGLGSSQQLGMEILLQSVGSKMTHIPFAGSGQLLAALVGNNVDVAFDTMTTAVPLVQAGTLRALGVSSLQRSPIIPDVPAVAEFVPDFDVTAWNAIFAPAGTPQPIVDKLSGTIAAIMQSPAIVQRLKELGTTAHGSTPAELADRVARDTKKFAAALAAAGIGRQCRSYPPSFRGAPPGSALRAVRAGSGASPESIIPGGGYGFRAPSLAARAPET